MDSEKKQFKKLNTVGRDTSTFESFRFNMALPTAQLYALAPAEKGMTVLTDQCSTPVGGNHGKRRK